MKKFAPDGNPACTLPRVVLAMAVCLAWPACVGAADTPSRESRGGPALMDMRLDPAERVLGIVVGDEPRAYAVADLETERSAVVHDSVAGLSVHVVRDHDGPRVDPEPAILREQSATTWASWSRQHPDTSLWHPTAVAEAEPTRSPSQVRIREFHGYKTVVGCAMGQSRLTSTAVEAPGLFVISGSVENLAASAVDHVVLRYELVDASGKVVYRDEGLNRSAEALAGEKLDDPSAVTPIAPGAADTFRMIFVTGELPVFETTRVSVARVY